MGLVFSRLLPFLLVFISYGQIRYKEPSFDDISTQPNLFYRTAPDYLSNPDSLFMDLYQPKDDTASARPAIMILYGGSFVSGSRKDALVVTLSNYFAHCGYAVFAIDYRIGVNTSAVIPLMEVPKAMFRAVQDSRAAVRFLRKNAQNFKIDTTRIFALGYSAGAIALIHHAYLDSQTAGQNQFLALAASVLGSLDEGDALDFSSKINCVINCCGAIADTSWIKPGSSPILSFHGTNDNIVPYGAGYINNDSSTIVLFGSSVIHQKASSIGLSNKLVTFDGADHYLEGAPRDSIPVVTAGFLYKLMNPTSIKSGSVFVHRTASRTKYQGMQYFDAAGRLLDHKRIIPSSFVLKRDPTGNKQLIKINSEY